MLIITSVARRSVRWTAQAALVGCLFLTACTVPLPLPQPLPLPDQGIADLDLYRQNVSAYTRPESAERLLIKPEQQAELDAAWNRQFFGPWHAPKATLSKESAFWGSKLFGASQGYAENLQPYAREEWDQLIAAQQMDSYPSLSRPAITVRNISVRLLPSNRPFFLNPLAAGEGFPFDYFQNSVLWTGTPLLITHVSADGAWYFAEVGFVFGWISADAIAWTNQEFRNTYETGRYAALLHDNLTLRDLNGEYLTQTHLGAIFPATENTDGTLGLTIPVRNADGHAVGRTARIAPPLAELKPLPLTPQRIAALADPLIGQRYGWGGLYDNRDCSATLRDLFTPFGIWLDRNSGQQANKGGELHLFAGLSAEEKRQTLLNKGIPFYTLVWLKGHIGLYLGPDPLNGEPLLLHSAWGVRTINQQGQEGREIIGRLVVTSLNPGEERRDVAKNSFYDRMLGMTFLPFYTPLAAPAQEKP